MKITEHLQFLFLMIPTLLLLAAAALTLAFPTANSSDPVPAATFAEEYSLGQEETAAEETGVRPAPAVTVK
ncbi:MAG: hypothetical protein ACREUO_01300 [Burkholderiales bacterium]